MIDINFSVTLLCLLPGDTFTFLLGLSSISFGVDVAVVVFAVVLDDTEVVLFGLVCCFVSGNICILATSFLAASNSSSFSTIASAITRSDTRPRVRCTDRRLLS